MSLLLALLTPPGVGAAALAMQHVERQLDRPVSHQDAPRDLPRAGALRPGVLRSRVLRSRVLAAVRRGRLVLPGRPFAGFRPAEARSRA